MKHGKKVSFILVGSGSLLLLFGALWLFFASEKDSLSIEGVWKMVYYQSSDGIILDYTKQEYSSEYLVITPQKYQQFHYENEKKVALFESTYETKDHTLCLKQNTSPAICYQYSRTNKTLTLKENKEEKRYDKITSLPEEKRRSERNETE